MFKAIFEHLPAASFSCDAEGVVVAWNEAAERLYGYKRQDAVGCKIVELIATPDSNDEEEGLIRQVFSGQELTGIKRSRRCADGRLLEVLTTFYPIRDLQGKVSRVVLVESKTVDLSGAEALRESHERFLTVLDSLDSGVYVADMETYEILFANQKMRNYFGNIEGKICWQVLQHGQSGPCDFCTNDKLLDADCEPTGVYAWEFQNTINGFWCEIRDRAIRWVDGRMVRLEIAMDITERKRAEEALRESEVRYRLLAENATDVIFTMDTNLQFTYLSPSVTNLTGYEVEEAMALELGEFLIPSSLDEVTEVLTEELVVEETPGKDLGRSRTLEFEIKRKDGSTICIEAKAAFLRDKQDQAIGILGVARDVTERKRA